MTNTNHYQTARAAQEFAEFAHRGQLRKYTNEPYSVHTAAVASFVEVAGGTVEMVMAAHLHDVLEDTPVTPDMLHIFFGSKVTSLVVGLTDKFPKFLYPELNRAERKNLETARLAAESAEIQTIKMADIIDNLNGISARDPKFAEVYLPEIKRLIESMHDAAPMLVTLAKELFHVEQAHLGLPDEAAYASPLRYPRYRRV